MPRGLYLRHPPSPNLLDHLGHPPHQPPSSKKAKASLNGSKWEAIDFNKEILLA